MGVYTLIEGGAMGWGLLYHPLAGGGFIKNGHDFSIEITPCLTLFD